MKQQIRCDVVVVGGGIAAIAAGRKLLDGERSVVFVELASERSVRGMFAIDPTLLSDREHSGTELDHLFFHSPAPHTVQRLFAFDEVPEVADDRIRYSVDNSEVIARRLLIAAAPGRVEIPEIPDAEELLGRSVSACAWSDAAFFADPVVVVGDGDFAYESALFAADFCGQVVVMTANGPRVSRALLRSRVEANSRIRVESGARVVGVRAAATDRVRIQCLRATSRHDLDAGGVIFASEPRYGADVLEILGSIDTALLGDAIAIAGGLTGVDENDHDALVRDGFRAADALLASSWR